MSREPRLPLIARLLVWLAPVSSDERAAVHADLHELLERRRSTHGRVRAHVRMYRDIASLWRLPLLSDARIDLRFAVRLFARQPGILLLTIAGLSVGLGIATSAFSVANAAALRGEGLEDSSRVPAVIKTIGLQSTATEWDYTEFVHLRAAASLMPVEGLITDAVQVSATGGEAAASPSVRIAFVSGGFFNATGARMTAGRPLGPADEAAAGDSLPIVISDMFWASHLNRDPRAIGRTIRVGRAHGVIVGIAAKGFTVPGMRQLWMPLDAYGPVFGATPARAREIASIQAFGRLPAGISSAEAEAQLSGAASSLPAVDGQRVRVRLDVSTGLGRQSEVLTVMAFVFVVIGLVLVLACANVATVLVATAITREREMGVRAALGASRRRIVRQLVTESLALGAVSAIFGLMFAYWAIPVIGRMVEAPPGVDLSPDLNVFVFLGVVTVLTGIGAGLAPARHGRGVDLIAPLKGETRQGRVAPRRLRSMLVMTQAGVSVLLIVLSALFVRATFRVATIDVGFETSGLYSVSAGLGYGTDAAAARAFWTRANAELEGVPGVTAYALNELAPFSGGTRTSLTRDDTPRVIHIHRTSAEYFETMGLNPIAGRTFSRAEVEGAIPVAVVSESLARAYWPGQSPLGQLLPAAIPFATPRPVVVGVVRDTVTAWLHERNALAIYEPFPPKEILAANMLVRVAPGATGAIDQAGQRLRAIDPNADVRIESIEAQVNQEAARPRMFAILTGAVGAVAIMLCVIGLYGMTASVVGQRTREMGVRMALGAKPSDLLRMLMWDSLRPALIGLAAGAAVAVLAGQVAVAAMFFGVSPQDPLALAGALGSLLAAAMLAVLAPTRRAVEIDPVAVLKQT